MGAPGIVRRILAKDAFNETDATTPDHWTNVGVATWLVESAGMAGSNEWCMRENTYGFPSVVRQNLYTRVVTQDSKLYFDIKFSMGGTVDVGRYMGIYIFCSAAAGATFGNSYFIRWDATTTKIYECVANSATERASESVTHSAATNYYCTVEYDPDTGEIVVYEGTTAEYESQTERASWTDTGPLTSGSYIAVEAYGVTNSDFALFRVRRPNNTPLPMNWHMNQTMSKNVSQFNGDFDNDDNGVQEYTVGDGIEVIMGDGTTNTYDFDGRVDAVEVNEEGTGASVTAFDWRFEGMTEEGQYSAGVGDVADVMIDIIRNRYTWLREGNVKALVGTNTARTLLGKYAHEQLWELCVEANYSMWQGFWREFYLTDTHTASGVTINDATSPVLRQKYTYDGLGMVNQAAVDRGAATRTSSDSSSQTAYGTKRLPIYNPTLSDNDFADDFGTNLVTRYATLTKIVDITVADYHELKLGQTCTVTSMGLNISSETGLVIQKEYGTDMIGIRFRISLNVGGNVNERELWTVLERLAMTRQLAQSITAYHM